MRREKIDNQVVPGCGFHHVAIRTANWERSLQFWQEGMGFHLAVQWGEAPRRACMLDTGDGNYLEIFERDPLPAGSTGEGSILHFCFRTDDCDAALERARAAGAVVTKEPTSLALFGEPKIPIRIAFLTGPDGEICELFQNEVL
ncbi:MAG: VOC family protein [Armatimonadota bacterium]